MLILFLCVPLWEWCEKQSVAGRLESLLLEDTETLLIQRPGKKDQHHHSPQEYGQFKAKELMHQPLDSIPSFEVPLNSKDKLWNALWPSWAEGMILDDEVKIKKHRVPLWWGKFKFVWVGRHGSWCNLRLALSLGNLPCQISQGNKIVEVASLAVRKGVVVGNALQQQPVKKFSNMQEPQHTRPVMIPCHSP